MLGVGLATTQIVREHMRVGEHCVGFGFTAEPQTGVNRAIAVAYSVRIK